MKKMKYLSIILRFAMLFLSCLFFVSCNKNVAAQYFGSDDVYLKPKEDLVTVMFEENIFLKYRNDIEVFEGINETKENLKIKHIVPQFPKILLAPGNYTFFVNSITKYTLVKNEQQVFTTPYLHRILFTGEAGKVYIFSQTDKGKEESFEFQTVKD